MWRWSLSTEKLVINRSKWARSGINGEVNGSNKLLNRRDCMCCLGFLAKECELEDNNIFGIGRPSNNHYIYSVICNKFPKYNTNFENEAVKINDNTDSKLLDNKEQEAAIIKLFKTIGVEVTFVD